MTRSPGRAWLTLFLAIAAAAYLYPLFVIVINSLKTFTEIMDNAIALPVAPVFRNFVERRGLDTSPLRDFLESQLDEAAIRASGRDLGIVTINTSDLRPREVFIEDMERDYSGKYLVVLREHGDTRLCHDLVLCEVCHLFGKISVLDRRLCRLCILVHGLEVGHMIAQLVLSRTDGAPLRVQVRYGGVNCVHVGLSGCLGIDVTRGKGGAKHTASRIRIEVTHTDRDLVLARVVASQLEGE